MKIAKSELKQIIKEELSASTSGADRVVNLADELAAKYKTAEAIDDAYLALRAKHGGLDSSRSRSVLEERDALLLAKELIENERLEKVAEELAMKYKTMANLRGAYGKAAQEYQKVSRSPTRPRGYPQQSMKSALGTPGTFQSQGGLPPEAYKLLFQLWALDKAKEKLKAGFGDEMKKAGIGIGAKWNEGIKLTKSKLKQIIKEEIAKVLNEKKSVLDETN